MPTHVRGDGKPVVEFNPLLEVSPFTLFRRLKDGPPVVLVDARSAPEGRTLRGATSFPGDSWEPPEDQDVLLFDDDGSEALPLVQRLQSAGFERVKMLFGGLELFQFALDPQVVGEETYLEEL